MRKQLAVMIDLSRNAVMKVDAIKNFISLLKQFNYNTLMLYMEDLYEIEGEEYFGYMRGRYTHEELKEIDDYCYSIGVEVIPCIQTLAHLNQITRWNEYGDIIDCDDILLVGEEKTYALIEKMIKTMRKCFRTNRLHIGMDEAHMLGKGKYLQKHGYRDPKYIFAEHLEKVSDICRKSGFTPMIWSDMPFKMVQPDGFYYGPTERLTQEVIDLIPRDVELVYWDYFLDSEEHYDNMLNGHERFGNTFWTAGACWTHAGLAPHNVWSIRATKGLLDCAEKHGVNKHIMALWHDSGGECPNFAALPSLCFAGEYFFGNKDIESIKQKFYDVVKIPFEDFIALDKMDVVDVEFKEMFNQNPSKYMLYNDCFMGMSDTTVELGAAEIYKQHAKQLEKYIDNKQFGYLFDWAKAMCDLLVVKYDLGVRLRNAYKAKDTKGLKDCLARMEKTAELMQNYYEKFRTAWYRDNKTFGFEVQDIRIGGAIHRLKHCIWRLNGYLNGEIDEIEELEVELLDVFGGKDNYGKKTGSLWDFRTLLTAGCITY